MMASGSLQDLAKTHPGLCGPLFFRDDLTAAFKGVLPGQHRLTGCLSGVPLGQFGGSHVAVGDVMPINGGWILNPRSVLVASH